MQSAGRGFADADLNNYQNIDLFQFLTENGSNYDKEFKVRLRYQLGLNAPAHEA
jgi:hypothetical protein